ncbi:MAG: polyribonucleotide nucleotidyltransferase, partial [Rickettsiales bacterium]|nr:polyribonucleotide nucleotidyltransferase [Rickettsiales bacterium]
MFTIATRTIEWGGRPLTLETGRIARQADGAVLVTYGNTVLLCTVVGAKKAKPDVDFFPLTVNYQEKAFAAGKIPGGFFKREGRPTEKETLTCRLIDRPIRPLFPEGFYNEVQVICTLLSHDMQNDPDIIAMIGTSAALTLSGIPFMGPIAGARVGYVDGEYLLNPTKLELLDSKLDLVVAGTKRSVLMVESEAQELSEEIMLGAVTFGHREMQPVIDMIVSLAEEAAKEPWNFEKKMDEELMTGMRSLLEFDLR